MNTRYPRLFGHDTRTTFLVGVALHGPITGRALAREVHLDPARVPVLFRAFRNAGVVHRNDDGLLRIVPTFPAFAELIVLLHAIGGQRVIVVPESTHQPAPWCKRSELFGTQARTKSLIALAALKNATVGDLAVTAQISERTVRSIVRHFANEGVMSIARDGVNVRVKFTTTHPLSDVLKNLLSRMRPSIRGLDARIRILEQSLVLPAAEENDNEKGSPAMLPFGTNIQSAVLGAVAASKALTTTDIVAGTGVGRSAVRTALDVLESAGIIVSTTEGSGPSRRRWVALNERHPVTPTLRRYAKRRRKAIRQGHLVPRRVRFSGGASFGPLPGQREMRSRILMEVYEHGQLEIGELASALKTKDRRPLRTWAANLRDAGLIEYGLYGGRMVLRTLDTAAPNAPELEALVAAVRVFDATHKLRKRT